MAWKALPAQRLKKTVAQQGGFVVEWTRHIAGANSHNMVAVTEFVDLVEGTKPAAKRQWA